MNMPARTARRSILLLASASLLAFTSQASLAAAAGASAQPAPEHADKPAVTRQDIGRANAAARVQPDEAGYQNAIQQYGWTEGALFQVYAAPGQITDIMLQEGETLVGPGPVAAGDTVRWIIGDTVSGTGSTKRVHILVKPTRADITTNLVINTDRRRSR